MNILFWVVFWSLGTWGVLTVLSLASWWLGVFVWVCRYACRYPSVQAAREVCESTMIYRLLTGWMQVMVTPLLVARVFWHEYTTFLVHQRTIEQLKRRGWHVETHTDRNGAMMINCSIAHNNATQAEAEAAIAEAEVICEEGGKRLMSRLPEEEEAEGK